VIVFTGCRVKNLSCETLIPYHVAEMENKLAISYPYLLFTRGSIYRQNPVYSESNTSKTRITDNRKLSTPTIQSVKDNNLSAAVMVIIAHWCPLSRYRPLRNHLPIGGAHQRTTSFVDSWEK
jgi:hypothetical protein